MFLKHRVVSLTYGSMSQSSVSKQAQSPIKAVKPTRLLALGCGEPHAATQTPTLVPVLGRGEDLGRGADQAAVLLAARDDASEIGQASAAGCTAGSTPRHHRVFPSDESVPPSILISECVLEDVLEN